MNANPPVTWREISEIPPVVPGEVQVWRINLLRPPAEITRRQNLLTNAEKNQAAQFHSDRDQRRFIVRRSARRQLLATHLGLKPEAIRIESANFQKPAIAETQNPDRLRFNCTHSADWALIAIAREQEVGVDLEQHRPMADAGDLAGEFFSAHEIRELAELPPALKLAGFYNCWTRKEAFVKAIGLGLACPLNRFSVTLSPGRPAALLEVADDPDARTKWSLISIAANPDYSSALVVAGKPPAVNLWEWNF
jgi:4'-phosphopantetheinyl transferase